MPNDPFADAKLLLQRALHQSDQFSRISSSLWSAQDSGSDCLLLLDRPKLQSLKPIASDIANNLIHSLDHVAAACAKLSGSARRKDIYFPLPENDNDFEAALKKLSASIEPRFLSSFRKTRQPPSEFGPHVRELKAVSNSAKHWELMPATANVHAVSYDAPGRGQVIIEIPPGHFDTSETFKFHIADGIVRPTPIQISIAVRIEGPGISLACDPQTLFSITSRYVSAVIADVEMA